MRALVAVLLVSALACAPQASVKIRQTPVEKAPQHNGRRVLAALSGPIGPDGPVDDEMPAQPYDLPALRVQLHAAGTAARRSCAPPSAGEGYVLVQDARGGNQEIMLFVSLRVGRDGRVDVAHVAPALGEPDDRSPLGECVRSAFGSAHVPSWSGARDATLDWMVLVPLARH